MAQSPLTNPIDSFVNQKVKIQPGGDSRKCQTATATTAEPGDLLTL
jgi:hypothetical protein